VISAAPEGGTLVHRAAQAFTAYRDGDRQALDELVELLTPLLWHTVRAQGADQTTAEDVVQTTWMRLLGGSDAIRDPQTVVGWLLTAARREAWRVVGRSRADLARTAGRPGDDGDDLAALPVPPEDLPEEVVLRDDGQRRLWQHVQALPDRCRELLRVIAFADRPDYAGIAASLGMPVGSIGPTRGRCLAKLRQLLATDPLWDLPEQRTWRGREA
jgi:RNA polymerase sigma factor (sigma-70 family)